MFFFCEGLLGEFVFEECKDDMDVFVYELLAPPLPPLFDLNLTNLQVLINDDVFGFELSELTLSQNDAASVGMIPESWPESYSLPDEISASCLKPLFANLGLVLNEYGDGRDFISKAGTTE